MLTTGKSIDTQTSMQAIAWALALGPLSPQSIVRLTMLNDATIRSSLMRGTRRGLFMARSDGRYSLASAVPSKTCKNCGVAKPIDQFAKTRAARDGYRRSCLDCTTGAWAVAS